MKKFGRKIVALLLCVVIVFGGAVVGGEDFVRMLDAATVKASAAIDPSSLNLRYPVAGYSKIYVSGTHYSSTGHTGTDFGASNSSDILAAADGVVKQIYEFYGKSTNNSDQTAGGTRIAIYHEALGIYTVYKHLDKVCVSQGQYVTAGYIIGSAGDTGYSSGYHLHFDICTSIHNYAYPDKDTTLNPEKCNYYFSGSQPTDVITATGLSLPSGNIVQGNDFNISGTLNSSYVISWSNASIYSDGTEIKKTSSASPRAYSFSISSFNSELDFGTLPPGNYSFVLRAGAYVNGKNVSMKNITSEFTVIRSDTVKPSILSVELGSVYSDGFYINFDVWDNIGVTSANITVAINGNQKTYRNATISGNNISLYIPFSDYNYSQGTYNILPIFYDAALNTCTAKIYNLTVITYTVSYNANGGSGAPSSQTKIYDKNLTLSSTKPTRSGYIFKGWSTSSTATTVQYAAGANYTANSNATLYAVWEYVPKTYTVSYNANGGTGAPSSQTKTENASIRLSTVKPTRSGYIFKGWSTSSTATTAQYAAGANYTDNSNATLYAVWCRPSIRFVNYEEKIIAEKGSTVYFSADVTDMPENAEICWYYNNKKQSAYGKNVEVDDVHENFTVYATIEDESGNILAKTYVITVELEKEDSIGFFDLLLSIISFPFDLLIMLLFWWA